MADLEAKIDRLLKPRKLGSWSPPHNPTCSVVALSTVTGMTLRESLAQLQREDPALRMEDVGVKAADFYQTVKRLWPGRFELQGPKNVGPAFATLTARTVGEVLPHLTGFVFSADHVMPCMGGRASNFCGYGDTPVSFMIAVQGVPRK